MNHKEKLTGVFPPVMTPFLNQEIQYDALRFNIEKMNTADLIGYMPLGSNGEFRSLTDEEALQVAKVVKETAVPGRVIMFGTGRESAWATVEFTKRCADIGMDLASVLAPHYFKARMDDNALLAYFTYIADRSPVPILMYNAPGFAAGLLISPAVVGKLAQHPNIVGMKDTSKEDIQIYIDAVPFEADFSLLAGSITKYYDALTKGAVGGVLSLANYMPELSCKIGELFFAGKKDEAKALSDKAITLNEKTSGKHAVAGVKAAMNLLGYKGLEPRLPLLPLPEEELALVRDALEQGGYLK